MERLYGHRDERTGNRQAILLQATAPLLDSTENPSTDPSYQGLRFGAVRNFAIYHSTVDPRTEVPPADLMPRAQGRNRFYLYSDAEVQRLLAETLKLRVGASSISPWVRYTLYGLLSVSGLRIGEALRLNLSDVGLTTGFSRSVTPSLASRGWFLFILRLAPHWEDICSGATTTSTGMTSNHFSYPAMALACAITMRGGLLSACRERSDCVIPRTGVARGFMISGIAQPCR
jgi:hypothetical protein